MRLSISKHAKQPKATCFASLTAMCCPDARVPNVIRFPATEFYQVKKIMDFCPASFTNLKALAGCPLNGCHINIVTTVFVFRQSQFKSFNEL